MGPRPWLLNKYGRAVKKFMREIVLDTETTGLKAKDGDRLVEIGCVELINHMASGNHYRSYINPERDMPIEAFRIHGLTEEFLLDKPVFTDIVDEFLEFIEDSPLIIHNAKFDMGFLNAELCIVGKPEIRIDRTIDTVEIARKKFPGSRVNLDALCTRFQIDNTSRQLHGALLDAQLLAEVYLELIGGRQPGLELAAGKAEMSSLKVAGPIIQRPPRAYAATSNETAAHEKFLDQLTAPIWRS
jgi:DNA polymerase-3 subunit epsilon